jgi:hypothetical protein
MTTNKASMAVEPEGAWGERAYSSYSVLGFNSTDLLLKSLISWSIYKFLLHALIWTSNEVPTVLSDSKSSAYQS